MCILQDIKQVTNVIDHEFKSPIKCVPLYIYIYINSCTVTFISNYKLPQFV
jgi:hypothetical protein